MDAQPLADSTFWLGIKPESWLMIAAVLFSPFLAVFAQRQIDLLREKRSLRKKVFGDLMMTRNATLTARHVEAVNAVPLMFKDSGKDKKVLDAWKEYLDHLNTDSKINTTAWAEKRAELFLELMVKMSECLGYKFERLRIKREGYIPQFFVDVEAEQHLLRRQLLELTDGTGRRKLPVASFEQKFPEIK